jgi:hypothetical protein
VPGKFADFFKDAARFSNRTAFALSAVFMAEQVIHRDIQHAGNFRDEIRPEGGRAAFPAGIRGLGDIYLINQVADEVRFERGGTEIRMRLKPPASS